MTHVQTCQGQTCVARPEGRGCHDTAADSTQCPCGFRGKKLLTLGSFDRTVDKWVLLGIFFNEINDMLVFAF